MMSWVPQSSQPRVTPVPCSISLWASLRVNLLRPQVTLREQLAALSLGDRGAGPLLESALSAPGVCPVLAKTRALPGRPQCPSQVRSPLGAKKGMRMRPTCSGQSTPTLL